MNRMPHHLVYGNEDMLDFFVALVLLLTLVSCQKPVGERAKRVLIPLEVIAVIFALKNRQSPLHQIPPDTCSVGQQGRDGFLSGVGVVRMTIRPFEDGELPPLS